MKRYLLDTDTCIEYLRNADSPVTVRMRAERRSTMLLCSIVIGELLYGAFCSRSRARDERLVRKFLGAFQSLPFDDWAADRYGKIRAELKSQGGMIGANDLLIASIALANDLVLVTHNLREFQRVKGLTVEDWQQTE